MGLGMVEAARATCPLYRFAALAFGQTPTG
jgi:hypothetical protein